MNEILIRLQELREKHNYTIEIMAEKLKLSQHLYTKYEKNPLCMPAEVLIKLSEIFNTSPDYILERTDIQLSIEDIEDLISANASEDLVECLYKEKRNHNKNNKRIYDDLAHWKKIIHSKLEETNITLKEIIQKTELSYETVYEYIYKPQSNTRVQMPTLVKILNALNLSIDTVLKANTIKYDNLLCKIAIKAKKLSPELKKIYISILDYLFFVDTTTFKGVHTDNKILIDSNEKGFTKRLRFLRKYIGNNKPGMTQFSLSLRIKEESNNTISCSERTVRNFELSEDPKIRYVIILSKIWNMPIDYLVGLSDDAIDSSRFEKFCNKYSKLTPTQKKVIENFLLEA